MPTPQDARQPQDRALKAEALGGSVIFWYQDVEYQIDRANADNLELMEFVEDEKYLSAIRGYLGPRQWKKWKDAHRDSEGRVATQQFEPFLNAVMAAMGGAGNSSASSGS